MMYNEIHTIGNQLPKWREAALSPPNGWRFFYFPDSVECAWYLLCQHPYTEHMVKGPTPTVDAKCDRVYSEMISVDLGWEMQDRLLPEATIVPLLCGSDKTQLSDFSSDQTAWLIYLSIGKIHSSIYNNSSNLAQLVLVFFPVPPKLQPNTGSDN
jgi:hypothetical protein